VTGKKLDIVVTSDGAKRNRTGTPDVYSWLLRNAAIPALLRFTNSNFWTLYQQMLQTEQLSPEAIQTLQWGRLIDMVDYAYQNVPYYAEMLDREGIRVCDMTSPQGFSRLPVTTKEDIQQNFPDRITAKTSNARQWRYVATRGTANRLIVIQDFYKRDVGRAAQLRSLQLSGGYRVGHRFSDIPPDACNVTCGEEGQPVQGVMRHLWRMVRTGKLRDASAISDLRGLIERDWVLRRKSYPPFGPYGSNPPSETLDAYVHGIRRDRPYLLKSLPTYLLQIARYLKRRGEPPLQVEVVKPMGASVSSEMRKRITSAFSGKYHEDYGSAELGGIACDCDRSAGLHVFSDLFYVEVVSSDGQPVAAGELGKIVITDLFNRAMPIIRYAIGDMGRLDHSPCACGRPTPRLTIEGRVEDTLVMNQGGVFTNDQLMDFFYQRDEVDQFQLVQQKGDRLDLTIVPSDGAALDLRNLASEVTDFLRADAPVRVFDARTIHPEVSGKFRFVKSSSYHKLP